MQTKFLHNMGSLGNTWFLGGALAVVVAGLLLALADAEHHSSAKNWSIVTFRESFGVIDALRIDAGGRIDFCRSDGGKILQQHSAAAPSGNIVGFFSDLETEIKRRHATGWERVPQPAMDQTNLPGPPDGPHWTIRHISQGPDNAEVRNLEGLAEVGSLVNLILDAVSQNADGADPHGGVLVIGPGVEPEWQPDKVVTTRDPVALHLLSAAGRFMGEPYPQQLKKQLAHHEGPASIDRGDLHFVMRPLQQ